MNKGKIKKILKIVLMVFVVITALYFWGERAVYFLANDDSLSGLPCYKDGDIATIEIRGEIVSYFVYSSVPKDMNDPTVYDAVSSEEVVTCINDIKNDASIDSVIVEIDSGGGSPFASEEIMNALKSLDKKTVAVIREMGTSGAYLVASATDRIFASAFSDIGSIGVTMSYLDYSQKNNSEGLVYQQLSVGEFKDYGDPDKPLTAEEKELIMRDLKIMHEVFIKNVATNRNLNIEKVRKLADGSSMLGVAAKENGLIDEIGDYEDAKLWLEEQVGTLR
jgi:protease-4